MRMIGGRNCRQILIKNRNSTVSSASTVKHMMTFKMSSAKLDQFFSKNVKMFEHILRHKEIKIP
jgi:hypothetical protein